MKKESASNNEALFILRRAVILRPHRKRLIFLAGFFHS